MCRNAPAEGGRTDGGENEISGATQNCTLWVTANRSKLRLKLDRENSYWDLGDLDISYQLKRVLFQASQASLTARQPALPLNV